MELNSAIVKVEMVDKETGEVVEKEFDVAKLVASQLTKKPSRSSSKAKIEENDTPIIRLEASKYTLTSGAITALDATPGESRLLIRYQKIGDIVVPLIAKNEDFGVKSGNKLAQGGTVSCRGKANDELSEFGSEFILVPHPSAANVFIMTQDGTLPEGNYSTESKKPAKKEEPKKEFAQPEAEDELDTLLSEDTVEISEDDFTL